MINMTKGEFLRMLTRVTANCNEDWPCTKVQELAARTYQNAIPKRSGLTDRFFLQGYTVLLDQSLDYEQLADPSLNLDMNFLLPKKGIELYLTSECEKNGFSKEKADFEVSREMRAFCWPSRTMHL